MSLTLSRPTVVDLAVLANAMSAEERRQYETATGLPHSADGVARSMVLFGGVEYLALDDAGNPVSAFGCFPLGGGVWQTWMVSRHDAFALHGRALSRLLRRVLVGLLDGDNVRRIQTYASADRAAACRWYRKALGMTAEGVLRGFYPDGSDAATFAITRA